jgi:carbamoyltransferase
MIVLGITDSIISGAAVIVDGVVVAAVNEERLNRLKMSMGFPSQSVAEVLRVSSVAPADIDYVAVATASLFWRPEAIGYTDYFRGSKGRARDALLALGSGVSTLAGDSAVARRAYARLKTALTRTRRKELPRRLKEQFGITAPVHFLDHHLCHAASAYFTSGFEEATVITQDGAGDGKCSRVYAVRQGRFKLLQSLDSYDSVGNYYSYVTHLCGFQAHKHEGKITGLAAHGEPEYLEILKRFVAFDGPGIRNTGRCFDHSAIAKLEKALPAGFDAANLSASVQALLEESLADYSDHWLKVSGLPDVALAGGVFANVKLNQRINEIERSRRIFVHPGMADDGLAVGAALFLCCVKGGYRHQPVIDHVYLGGEPGSAEARRAADRAGLRYVELGARLPAVVAELLARGKIVARCAGRMEYGPRALGNRTIMYQTTDPSVNKWLNAQLRRTEFMPFAPVTLWEHRHECYRDIGGAEQAARFMTITFDCRPSMRAASPAVCHVDNTARPQLIRREDNPDYYDIVKAYHKLTGIPSLVNTSFNMHEEPIVNTAEQALQAFLESELDALILGDLLVPSNALDLSVFESSPVRRNPARQVASEPLRTQSSPPG